LPKAFDLVRQSMDLLLEDGLDPDVLNRELGFGLKSDFRFEHRDPDWLNAGLRHLLLLCWRQQHEGQNAARADELHPMVLKAMHRVGSGDNENLTELAAACAVSKAYLSRVFARQLGVSLTRYRNSMRLRAFWSKLGEQGGRNITEAMYMAGFGSYAQFYKIFQEAYGESPRASLRRRAVNA
jgi:methylphosphotriester-DNA--protein-cysteine methyltransferase